MSKNIEITIRNLRSTLLEGPTRGSWVSGVKKHPCVMSIASESTLGDQDICEFSNRFFDEEDQAQRAVNAKWVAGASPDAIEQLLNSHEQLSNEFSLMAVELFRTRELLSRAQGELAEAKRLMIGQEKSDSIKALERSLLALKSVKLAIEFPPIQFDVTNMIALAIEDAAKTIGSKH